MPGGGRHHRARRPCRCATGSRSTPTSSRPAPSPTGIAPGAPDVEPAALVSESLPSVLPGPLSPGVGGVDEQLSVDGVAHVALERAEGFLLGLALGDLAVEVGATVGVGLADLADGGEVDGVVQAPVPTLGQAVDGSPAGGQLDGGGAVVGRELVSVAEPTH